MYIYKLLYYKTCLSMHIYIYIHTYSSLYSLALVVVVVVVVAVVVVVVVVIVVVVLLLLLIIMIIVIITSNTQDTQTGRGVSRRSLSSRNLLSRRDSISAFALSEISRMLNTNIQYPSLLSRQYLCECSMLSDMHVANTCSICMRI